MNNKRFEDLEDRLVEYEIEEMDRTIQKLMQENKILLEQVYELKQRLLARGEDL